MAVVAMVLGVVAATTIDAYTFGPSYPQHPGGSRRRNLASRSSTDASPSPCRRVRSAATLNLFPTAPSVSAASQRPVMVKPLLRPKRSSSRGNKSVPPSFTTATTTTTTTTPSQGPLLASTMAISSSSTNYSILSSRTTAHGLLSPEVVMRIMDSMTGGSTSSSMSPTMESFLDLYKSRGPMACLPLLSDTTVLPELTRAMREIA